MTPLYPFWALQIKVKLEEGQRARRKEMEQNRVSYSPRWFEQQDDPMVPSGQQHKFKVLAGMFPFFILSRRANES